MKLTAKTRGTFVGVLLLALFIGTLSWEIIERIVSSLGLTLDLSIGPVGFDAFVVAVWVRINPGTVVALYPGIRVFQSI